VSIKHKKMAKNLSCGVSCTRGVLLALNIFFVLVGLAFIGAGIYVKINNDFSAILDQFTDEKEYEAQSLGFLAFAMIGGGVFTLLIALFGCLGTLWNKRCFLYMYAVILGLLMIIELVGFIMAFVYKGQLKDVYETALLQIFDRGLKENNLKIINAFHELEKNLDCCGIHNISDYYPYNNGTESSSEGCIKYPMEGCSAKMIDLLNTSLPIVGYSLLVIFLIEFFGVLAAVVLAVALKHASKPKQTIITSSPGEKLGYNEQRKPEHRANYHKP